MTDYEKVKVDFLNALIKKEKKIKLTDLPNKITINSTFVHILYTSKSLFGFPITFDGRMNNNLRNKYFGEL